MASLPHANGQSGVPDGFSRPLAPDEEKKEEGYDLEPQSSNQEGQQKFCKLGWKRLTICLIVEAIALGSLSIPDAFAKVGMVAGVTLCIGIGLLAIYTSYVVGQVKLQYPEANHYADAVRLIWGRFGYEVTSVMFIFLLVLLVGSHTLTGTIAWVNIVKNQDMCVLVWGGISAVLLFLLAIPPTFTEFAVLGYIDFVSISLAIAITIIATGVAGSNAAGGLAAVNWSVWPPEDVSFTSAVLAVVDIVFAYSFSVCQFSFMSELHTPKDFVKSIWALGLIEMCIYTLTGALIYTFVGNAVRSPALLSAGPKLVQPTFIIALPVIFISGSINSTVCARFILDRFFHDSPIRFIHSKAGWAVWIGLLALQTVLGWVIAEAIPFFGDLLGIISALFVSGFTFYFPALFWFQLVKEGKWNESRKNIMLTLLNILCFVVGLLILVCGTYACVNDILDQYSSGSVRSPFTCDSSAYAG